MSDGRLHPGAAQALGEHEPRYSYTSRIMTKRAARTLGLPNEALGAGAAGDITVTREKNRERCSRARLGSRTETRGRNGKTWMYEDPRIREAGLRPWA